MLEARNITKRFILDEVLKGISFRVASGGIAGLIGPSGGGKSVLLKILAGVLDADSGTVEAGCIESNDISLMFQEGALFDSLNVFDNCAFSLVQGRVPTTILPRTIRRRVHERVDYLLARVGLSDASQKMPGQLSGGMRRRLSLARALAPDPKLLLLDDPTCGLDPVASSVIMDLIVEHQRISKPTTVIVSHDLRRLLPVVDTVNGLFNGRIVFEDRVDNLENGAPEYVKQFVACRYDFDGSATRRSSPGDATS